MKTILAEIPLDENRLVRIYAPISVTKAEFARISAWLATQLYVTDDGKAEVITKAGKLGY